MFSKFLSFINEEAVMHFQQNLRLSGVIHQIINSCSLLKPQVQSVEQLPGVKAEESHAVKGLPGQLTHSRTTDLSRRRFVTKYLASIWSLMKELLLLATKNSKQPSSPDSQILHPPLNSKKGELCSSRLHAISHMSLLHQSYKFLLKLKGIS